MWTCVRSRKPELFWGAAIGSLVVADVRAAQRRDDSTLSCVTRQTFKVHTPTGRLLFVGGWIALSAWFLPHILVPALHDIADDLGALS
jgi:hypothetical protein